MPRPPTHGTGLTWLSCDRQRETHVTTTIQSLFLSGRNVLVIYTFLFSFLLYFSALYLFSISIFSFFLSPPFFLFFLFFLSTLCYHASYLEFYSKSTRYSVKLFARSSFGPCWSIFTTYAPTETVLNLRMHLRNAVLQQCDECRGTFDFRFKWIKNCTWK